MTDGLNNLTKMDSPNSESQEKSIGSNLYLNSKRKIQEICNLIASPSEKFDPQIIVNSVREYIDNQSFLTRLLYSEISGFIYGLEDLKLENFISNIDTLQAYISDKQASIDTKTQNAIVKLCDHASLAKQQKELLSDERIANVTAAQNDIKSSYETLKNDLQELREANQEVRKSLQKSKDEYKNLNKKLIDTEKEYKDTVKQTQKDYISIFGVFSAIIITFVGGLSFTTSVMDGIDLASPYRIVFIVALIGFVVINMVHYLVHFLWRISGNENNKNRFIVFINTFFILLMVFDFIVFFLVEKIDFIGYITEILQDLACILNQTAEDLSNKANKQ